MATFTAIKNRGGGRGALGGVLRYVQQKEKTTWGEQRLVSGWNCTAQSVCAEMQLTKERFRKTDGRQYYHFVQSFGVQDNGTNSRQSQRRAIQPDDSKAGGGDCSGPEANRGAAKYGSYAA